VRVWIGQARRSGSPRGTAVILAPEASTTNLAGARNCYRKVEQDWSFGNPAAWATAFGREKVGADNRPADEAWWFPAIQWRPAGCNSCSTSG